MYRISVGQLVEYVTAGGSLSASYQSPARAQAGTKAHQYLQQSRPSDYQAEINISLSLPQHSLEVFGRIDGLYPDYNPPVLEEIKTTWLPLDELNTKHKRHWAQAHVYAYIYCLQNNLPHIIVRLTYFNLDTEQTRELDKLYSFAELTGIFNDYLKAFTGFSNRLHSWRQRRDTSINQLQFPYGKWRPGQQMLADEIAQTIANQGLLFAQAATGSGKTAAALFPAIKSLGLNRADRLFFLTARTQGRLIAEKTISDLQATGLQLISVTITAKDKICFNPGHKCEPEDCPFAAGYYDRLPKALSEVFARRQLVRDQVEDLAHQHAICPFELSLDIALWSDLIICDYNYAFDPRVYLRRFFSETQENYAFLIDEAHNLPDRAREMYSAELIKKDITALHKVIKQHLPTIAVKLQAINKALTDLRKQAAQSNPPVLVYHEPPAELVKLIRKFTVSTDYWLGKNIQTDFREQLLDFYFACLGFIRAAEDFDSDFVTYYQTLGTSNLLAKIFCLSPARLLNKKLQNAKASVFFSATLLPMHYFCTELTANPDQPSLIIDSPFASYNLGMFIDNRLSTLYRNRTQSLPAIAQQIATLTTARPGNYLVFFPSYAYQQAVAAGYYQLTGSMPLMQQTGMTETDRAAFLNRFEQGNNTVAFGVMGGIFAESIDLTGDRLIGVAIVGVSLPQVCLERELMREWWDEFNGQGFAFAYQYPGFNKVLQAAGRVIRTDDDRGVVLLIGSRFTRDDYLELLPNHWNHWKRVKSPAHLKQLLLDFWG